MSKELNSNKLNGKDLINAGIFSAIYVVIIMLVACTVGMIPIGFILLTLLVPLLEGIPMMLYFSKIKKVGMIMILQVVIGLAMIITGMGYDLLIWGIVTGIIAEIIMKVTKYKKGIACVLAYAVSCICIAGNYVHWISYLKEIIKKWKKSGKTVIIAEHRLYWLMDLADRVIYMDNGYIVQDLLINEFREYSENDLHQMGLRNSIASENSLYRCNERDTGLTFTDFSFSYKNAPHKALDIEKLSIPKGAIVAVLGNNGAGKTTFGRCLCGLEKRCKGTVILENRELTQKQRIALSYIVMQDVNHQLFTESVIDEILLSMEKQPGTLEEKEKRAMEILHLLKLQEFRECHPMSLSGGQKQRVAIASALGSGKKILVYDEPTSGLDYRHMLDVAEAIREMKKADNTQFIITHDAELVSHCCDYIILMQSGKIIKQGSLMNQDINKAVREFWKQ